LQLHSLLFSVHNYFHIALFLSLKNILLFELNYSRLVKGETRKLGKKTITPSSFHGIKYTTKLIGSKRYILILIN